MRRACLVIPMPVSPVERLASEFRNYLHLPDPSALYVLFGAVAANMMEGSPCWIMLVGPPSCGKTELLNSLLTLPHMVEGADIGSEAAFLSGSPSKDKAKDATGGLLRQIGDHGGLILNDFTSILSKPQDRISTLMGVFRETFGGRWTRHVGSEGGRAMQWTGKLALFAGVTGAIDQHHQVNAELGERWVYYRYPQKEVFAEAMMSLSNGDRGKWREELREKVREFFGGLGLGFGASAPRRSFTDAEKVRLYNTANVASRCRSGVARDSYSKEIIGARETEVATRLATVLGQLLLGMDRIGVPEPARWRLLGKVAMDSMPKLRRIVIESVSQKPLTTDNLAVLMGCSTSVAKRVVEDLGVHEVVVHESGVVTLSPWMQKHYKAVR